MNAMLSSASSERGVPVLPKDLDADPYLFNCLNGTLDLRTGRLREHTREDLITKLSPVEYDPEAKCPTFDAFINRIMAGREKLIAFLQCAFGYALTGDVSERALFILYGCGANGKSVLVETLHAILGDYAMRTPTETLMVKQKGAIPNDVARLKGARFVTANESEEGQRLAESLIKDLTGGDTISARFMRAEFFDFKPECKVWLRTNHKPVIRGTDKAIWDRVKLIPFDVRIPDAEQDKHLMAKLAAEAPGILAWMVEGCLAWQRAGLGIPEEVKKATDSYRAEMDVIQSFIDDRCYLSETAEVKAGDLHAQYLYWSERNGERPMSKRAFGLRLEEKGFTPTRSSHSRGWRGVGLVEAE
jgi:putative DNA primase/helicase